MESIPEIHEKAIVVAGHTDLVASSVDPLRLKGERGVLETHHVPRLREGGITAICDHVGGDTRYGLLPATKLVSTPLQRLMRMIDHVHNEAAESKSILLVSGVEDIYRAKKENRIALVLCMEGASPLEDELACLRNLHRLGLRSLGLTHNWRNSLADGALERGGGGLSHFGMDVVQECNRLGIVVDVAHLSDRGIEDVLSITSKPIISSHANTRALCPQARNLTDEQIKGIADSGGVVGIHAIDFLVGEKENLTVNDILRHIAHIVDVGGVDCVGIGPDLMERWPREAFKAVTEGALKFASVPVKATAYEYPEGFRSLAQLPNLTAGLIDLGFTNEEITKILGANFLRVYERVWESGN